VPRLGRGFEEVVAEVVRAMDPSVTVSIGAWVKGPDGRREVDVLIEGCVEGVPQKAIVECKDFNPKTTGPVGIGYLDALDSKRRDLGLKLAVIASNAGFTSDAISKGKRLGIGVVGIMREGDDRLRFAVQDEIYTRQVSIRDNNFKITYGSNDAEIERVVSTGEATFEGKLVSNWLLSRAVIAVVANPIVQGQFAWDYTFTSPVEFTWPGGCAAVSSMRIWFTLVGAWFAHQVVLDASSGIYDFVRRRVRVSPGGGFFRTKNIDFYGGTRIQRPDDHELNRRQVPGTPGEFEFGYLLFRGHVPAKADVPDLDRFVLPSDLEYFVKDIPDSMKTSSSEADFPRAKPANSGVSPKTSPMRKRRSSTRTTRRGKR
jgi:hypothetical protein